MRWVQRLSAACSVSGVLLVMAGGMHVQRGPNGTWFQFNVVHAAGGVAILLGTLLSVVATATGDRPRV